MNIDLRQAVKHNLKDSSSLDIYKTIEAATGSTEDVVLPGLGVLFEIVWKNSDKTYRDSIVGVLSKHL